MHAIRAVRAAALAVTALALAAPSAAAGAEESFQVSASPTTVAAGGQVTLSQSGCPRRTTVTAGIFDTVPLGGGKSSKSVTVDQDAKQGAVYTVTFSCAGGPSRTVDLTIAGGRPDDQSSPPVDHGVDHGVEHGVEAGVGGSADGLGLREIGLGAALITGALGAAYHFLRRRASDDNA